MKRIFTRCGWAALILILFLGGCGEDSDPTRQNDFVPLTGITVESSRPQIAADTTTPFTATGDFSGVFSREVSDEVTWSSSDPNILTVDETGLGRGVAPGAVTVTASAQGVSGSVDFTVSDARAVAVALAPELIEIPEGGTEQVTATATFDDDTTQPVTDVAAWSSTDEMVATVDQAGLVRGVAPGSATIRAEFHSIGGEATVTVSEAAIESLELAPLDPFTTLSDPVQFTLTGVFSDGTTLDVTEDALWTSSDPDVATVDSAGLATPEGEGVTTIEATIEGLSASTDLEVGTLSTIELDPDDSTPLSVGSERTLSATGIFDNGDRIDLSDQVTWTSGDTAVATVGNTQDTRGIVTGVAGGEVEIRATLGDISGSTTVFVR